MREPSQLYHSLCFLLFFSLYVPPSVSFPLMSLCVSYTLPSLLSENCFENVTNIFMLV
jgi:hypothetical protein